MCNQGLIKNLRLEFNEFVDYDFADKTIEDFFRYFPSVQGHVHEYGVQWRAKFAYDYLQAKQERFPEEQYPKNLIVYHKAHGYEPAYRHVEELALPSLSIYDNGDRVYGVTSVKVWLL